MNCNQGAIHSQFAKVTSNGFKLLLKRSKVFSLCELMHNLSFTTVFADHNDKEIALAS